MKRKLPIAETALGAITFALSNVWPTIRLGWFAILLFLAILVGGGWLIVSGAPGLADGFTALAEHVEAESASSAGTYRMPPEEASEIMAAHMGEVELGRVVVGGLLIVFGWFVFVPIAVLLFRVAAGDIEMPGGFFYWKWGGRETRFVITLVLYTIIVQGAVTAIAYALEKIALELGTSGDLTLTWLPNVMPIISFVITLWITLRTVLIPTAAAVENDFNPVEATKATGGNFFRILGSLILLALIMMACLIGFAIAMFILVLLTGVAGMGIGDSTAGGAAIGIVSLLLFLVPSLFVALACQLVSYGWAGMAWGALRKDNVRACGPDGPGEGGVCEVA